MENGEVKTEFACGNRSCAHLHREILALERLVDHYQQELVASSSCSTCGRSLGQASRPVLDDLFEYQQLNALEWTPENGTPHAASFLMRADSTLCDFHEVELPSDDWTWTSDWRILVDNKTDMNGWTYALSREDLDGAKDCNSERTAVDRVRRRRWQCERKYVGVGIDSPSITQWLEHETKMSALQHANEKLTEQLRKANDRLSEYENRMKQYEAKLMELQRAQGPVAMKKPFKFEPISSDAPFSPSKSREVLHQTEALLSQMYDSSPLLDDQTIETQRRRSQMVVECHSELDNAVSEFHSLVGKFDHQHGGI